MKSGQRSIKLSMYTNNKIIISSSFRMIIINKEDGADEVSLNSFPD